MPGQYRRLQLRVRKRVRWETLRGGHRRMSVTALYERRYLQPGKYP